MKSDYDARKLGYWQKIVKDPQVQCGKDQTLLKPYELKIGYDGKLEMKIQKFIPANKYGKEQVSHFSFNSRTGQKL